MQPRPIAQLEQAVASFLKTADLEQAIVHSETELAKLPRTDYHQVMGRTWLKQMREAANWMVSFYRSAAKEFSVQSLYFEMNRFEINPDQWHVDGFAYDVFGGSGDLNWLVQYKKVTEVQNRLVLHGMADLQVLFARDYRNTPPPEIFAASQIAILLLTLRMQELFDAAASIVRTFGQLPEEVPVLSTAHDSDLVCCSYGEIEPPITFSQPH